MCRILCVTPILLLLGCVGQFLNPNYSARSIELLSDIERLCTNGTVSEIEECINRCKDCFEKDEVKMLYIADDGKLTSDSFTGRPVIQYCLKKERNIPIDTWIDICIGKEGDGKIRYIAFEADLCCKHFSQINWIVRKLERKGFIFVKYDVPKLYNVNSRIISVKAHYET